jgi:S-adenosylmethionine decarboxylase
MDGRQIKVLGQGDLALLSSPKAVGQFLPELVEALGMRIMGEPHIYKEDHGGVTGVAVLSTSHAIIHTQRKKVGQLERGFFSLDVYSCRAFPNEPVEQLLKEHFGASKIMITDVSGALTFP